MVTDAPPTRPGRSVGDPAPKDRGSARGRPLLAPILLVALPLVVTAVVLCARRPVVHFADDRAMIELAVRRAVAHQQLIGNGTRFGWSDLGPAVFYLLAPLYWVIGRHPFAIPAGLLLLYGATAAAVVWTIGRRRGVGAAYVTTMGILVYLVAFGFGHFTNVWAPWEVILPLLLVLVLSAVGAAEAGSPWALLAAAAVGSVMIQTKIEMVVIVPIVLLGALVMRTLHHGIPLVGRDRRAWRQPLSLVFLTVTVVLWLPPLWQQVTGHPGNLGEVARFTLRGATGGGPSGMQRHHSVGEAVTTLGEELSIFPLGHRGVVAPGFEHRVVAEPGWAIALAAAYQGVTAAVAWIAIRRKDRLAASLAAITLVAMLATEAWTMHILGPVSFFLVAWASILPLGTWLAVLLLLTSTSGAGRPRARSRPVEVVTASGAVLVACALVVGHARTFDYNRDRSAQIAALDMRIDRRQSVRGLSVRVHIATAPCWPVATGVVLDLTKRGAHVTVDPSWVIYFGSRFVGGRPPTMELWFDQPGVAPSAPPGADRVGVTRDIVLSQRVAPASGS
jgi:hypothetical protein